MAARSDTGFETIAGCQSKVDSAKTEPAGWYILALETFFLFCAHNFKPAIAEA